MIISRDLIRDSNINEILKELIYNLIKSCIIKWIQNTHHTNNYNIKIQINYDKTNILKLIGLSDVKDLLFSNLRDKQIEFITDDKDKDNTDCYYALLYHIIDNTFNNTFTKTDNFDIDIDILKTHINDNYLYTDNYADNYLNMIDLILTNKDNLYYCKYQQDEKIIGLSLQIESNSKNIILFTTILENFQSDSDNLSNIYKTHNLENFCIHNPHHLHDASIDYDNTDFIPDPNISDYQKIINDYIPNAPIKCYKYKQK